MMSQDLDLLEEYKQRLTEKYTASELCEILGITIEELLDAFPYKWEENGFLLEETGILKSED